jgi:hypothetical protein
MKGMRKPPLKENSAALRENLTFKLKFSDKFSRSPNLFPTATPK